MLFQKCVLRTKFDIYVLLQCVNQELERILVTYLVFISYHIRNLFSKRFTMGHVLA